MFKQDLCTSCGDCLVECQWMDVEREQAVKWIDQMIAGKQVPVLNHCITCYACNEICRLRSYGSQCRRRSKTVC